MMIKIKRDRDIISVGYGFVRIMSNKQIVSSSARQYFPSGLSARQI